MLSWNFRALQIEVDVKSTNTSDGNFTFSSYSSVKVVNSTLKPLVTITCTANGPALNFQTQQSAAVVDITQKSTKLNWEEIDVDEIYAEMNTRVELECAGEETGATSILWKLGGISSSQILMFLSDGQMKQAMSINSTIMFSDKGTLIFPNISIQQEGLYTCVYTDGDKYYSHTFTVILTESSDNRVTNIIIVTVIVGGVVFLVVAAALFTMCARVLCTRRAKKNSPTSVLEELVDSLTFWPLSPLSETDFFENKVISSFRHVSNEIDQDKKREDKMVTNTATAMIVASAFLPITKVLWLLAGAAISVAETEDDTAATWDKVSKDKQESKLVQDRLQNLIDIQKQLAETTVFLDFAYKAICEVHVDTCLSESHRKRITNMMAQVKEKQKLNGITLMEQVYHIHSCICELLNMITKEISNESAILVKYSEWESKLNDAKSVPFQYLPESIKYLVYRKHNDVQETFLTFVKGMYYPCQRVSHGSTKVGVRLAKQGNVTTEFVDVHEDAVKIESSGCKIIRGVSAAGFLLHKLGIEVDVAFLGSAVQNLQKKGKEKFAEAFTEAADVMEIMNNIINELAQK